MRLAFWLMNRFGVPEPLVGDLLEERSRRRSALWQWRQTVVAILWAVARDIRAHRWLAARAVLTGWAVGQLAAPVWRIAMPLMSGAWVSNSEQWLSNSLGFPIVPLPFLIVMSATAVITGWVVARLHRGFEMSMVSAYIVALLIFYVGGFINSLDRGVQALGVYGLAVNSVFPFVVTPALVVLGGLLNGVHSRRARLMPEK
jgi:hypothetical protein